MVETTIILRGHAAIAERSVGNLVIPLLEHPVRRFAPGGLLGFRHEKQVVRHYTLNDDGDLVFSAGLVPRIRRQLEAHGYLVHVVDRSFWGHLRGANLDIECRRELSAEEAGLIAQIENEPRGLILLRRQSDIGRIIAIFSSIFEKLNIFVVACNRHRVQKLVGEISRHTERSVTSDSRAVWKHNPRLFVGTVKLFHHAGPEGFDVVIFADVESVLADHTANMPGIWHQRTWYGFLEIPRNLSEYEQFRLEELCGPIVCAAGDGQPKAKVQVKFEPVQRDIRPNAAGKGLERKRASYWHSAAWNEAVVRSANEYAGSKQQKSVGILVESSEHGRELLEYLPDWDLLTDNTPTSCIPVVGHQQIATFSYAERWGIGTEVLIRADGGIGWPLSSRLQGIAAMGIDSVLLVDFDDNVDSTANKNTKSRKAAYERMWSNSLVGNSGSSPYIAGQRASRTSGQIVRTPEPLNQFCSVKSDKSAQHDN